MQPIPEMSCDITGFTDDIDHSFECTVLVTSCASRFPYTEVAKEVVGCCISYQEAMCSSVYAYYCTRTVIDYCE